MSSLLGGGQTYLINLLDELPAAEVFLIVPEDLKAHFLNRKRLTVISVGRWNLNPLIRVIWENFRLPKLLKRLGIDVYYSTGGLFPFMPLPCKTVSAFRNMLPFSKVDRQRFPIGYKRVRYFFLRILLGRAFRRADAVIFISNYAKRVIDRTIPQRRGISEVIYHGVGEEYRRSDKRPLPRPTGLPPEYVLYVSILNFYKCHLEVVEAWSLLRQRRPTTEKLAFIGPEYAPYGAKVRALITALGLGDEILMLGKIPHEKLPAYYQNAKANIFASTCENCPNILLEAMASGTPVLSSDIEPMPEIAQSGAKLFSPFDPQQLAQVLEEILDDQEVSRHMARAASLRAEKFSWKESRVHTWGLLTSLAHSK